MVEENDTPSFSKELAVNNPASLLEMAQRVHDDFVEKGRATAEKLESDAQKKHDELISSAREFHDISILETESNAAAIIEDAQLSAFTLISDAKIKADGIVSGAEASILQLETSILKLQEFEAAYRGNLQALVAGAQATLVVAELAVEDNKVSELEDDESEEPNVSYQNKNLRHIMTSVEPVNEIHSEDDAAADSADELVEPEPIIYNFDNFDTSTYYDPLAVKPVLDPEVSASIIAASGLTEDADSEDENATDEDSDNDTSGDESEAADDATDATDEAVTGEFVGISSETSEPIYYDPSTLTSGTDPEIVAATVGEPGAGKGLTEDESSDDETDSEDDTEEDKK